MPSQLDQLILAFRTRLASDPQLRRDFAAAPLGTLKRAGVQVSPTQARLLQYQILTAPTPPPVSTLTVRDGVPGNLGWLLAPVTIVLSAQDFSGTGIQAIETSPDRATWTRYTEPFRYTAEGMTRLYYRARDNTLNEEQPKSRDFKIDTRPPVIEVSVNQPSITRVEPLIVHFSATDPVPGSGLATVTATLDAIAVADGQTIDLLWYPLGAHTLSVTASDVAGLTSTRTAAFELIATQQSLIALIRKLRDLGEIDSAGIANSLRVKAEHAQYGALLNEIRAQSGHHITVRAADLLRGDVEYVKAHTP